MHCTRKAVAKTIHSIADPLGVQHTHYNTSTIRDTLDHSMTGGTPSYNINDNTLDYSILRGHTRLQYIEGTHSTTYD